MIRKRRGYRTNMPEYEDNLDDLTTNLTQDLLSQNLTANNPVDPGVPDWLVALLTLAILVTALLVIYMNWYHTLKYNFSTNSSETEEEWQAR